jgi:hypothetical protein
LRFLLPLTWANCTVYTSNIPSTKSHIHFLSLRSFIQGISPDPRLLVIFHKKLIFYGEELSAPRPTPKLEGHPLSAVQECLINIFPATLHLESISSIHNLRACHAKVSRDPPNISKYQNIIVIQMFTQYIKDETAPSFRTNSVT